MSDEQTNIGESIRRDDLEYQRQCEAEAYPEHQCKACGLPCDCGADDAEDCEYCNECVEEMDNQDDEDQE